MNSGKGSLASLGISAAGSRFVREADSLTPAKRLNFWRVRKDGGISGPAPVVLESEVKEKK
ncbi:MAG: hypothetical protein ACRD2Q_00215 [Terriglobales bacterium]